MNSGTTTGRPFVAAAASIAMLTALGATTVAATQPATAAPASPQLEKLDRGLVAVPSAEGNFLSWRLLKAETTGATAQGLEAADFQVFRDGRRIATVTDSTNYLDTAGMSTSRYQVRPVLDGERGEMSRPATPKKQAYDELPLQKPADGVTPTGEAYTYRANDMSVSDTDGDGTYEYVVKWDPSNSKDVSQKGYTGPVYLDTYQADGTLLHRIDLGVNIRAGAHYTQFLVYDFDGDDRAEIMTKTAPGTRTIRYRDNKPTSSKHITMLREDIEAGYANTDDYRMSAADYYEHVVEMFRGWHDHPEVKAGSWPATLEEAFGIERRYDYPLSETDAKALADHFIDVYAPSRSTRNDLRTFAGFVVDGPEYLTVFEGATGEELETVRYQPGRGDDGLLWGDYAMSRIEPGNRVDRFLSGVAYLDGNHPSAVFARGYYTRSTLVAYDWDGKNLKQRWYVDSGHTPMSNPFNDSPHDKDGSDPVYGKITTQGAHSLSAADVDDDGKMEIVYGAATIDDDGSLLSSSFGTLPEGSKNPGAYVRLGHGDAMHVTDIDPQRAGKEVFMVHEGATGAPYGMALRDGANGEVLFGAYSGRDTGRGMVGDVVPESPGLEVWASMPDGSEGSGLMSADGEQLATAVPGTNMNIKWAADMTTQIVNGSGDATPTIHDWQDGTVLTATGTLTNNGTKGNPSLVADVHGDWREELLVRTADSTAIRIYTSTEVTDRKLYTLMHDTQYRAEVARQQTTYNQPSYTSFYLGSDIDWSKVPVGR